MKRKLCLVVIFFISFLAGILYFGGKYFTFGILFEDLLLILAMPLVGTNNAVIELILKDSLIFVLLPSVLCAIFITFLPNIWRNHFIQKCYATTKEYVRQIFSHSIALRLFIGICFLIIGFNVADKKLEILSTINYHFFEEYSNFYEENYIKPNVADYKNPQNPRNLIVIFAESMESTFSGENNPIEFIEMGGGRDNTQMRYSPHGELISEEQLKYSPYGELIPNLTHLAQNGVNFSANGTLGGHLPTATTGSTMSATVSYICGIPLKFTSKFAKQKNQILPNATCIGNVLDSLGYNQVAFTGQKSHFGGYATFIKSQHFNAFDADYFDENGLIKERANWGINDYELFGFAKQYLQDYKRDAPLAMYISTIDSHYPGFVDKAFCKDLETNYENAIRCSDRIIGDFVEFVKKSRFGKNTTIVIVGDHLSTERNFVPQETHRYIYNAFINPHFSVNPSQNLTKNRELSHYDITALILDSIGFKVESFGLGRNPLYGKTLIEQYGIDEFNRHIRAHSKVYEGFW